MNRLELCCLRSVEELYGAAPAWNSLWQRSDVSVPLARAEFVAQWLRQFGQGDAFRALVIKQGELFLAALPLVGAPTRPLRRGGLTGNTWALCGDFLLDGTADEERVCGALAGGLNEVPWPLVCLAPVAYESRRWRLLVAAAAARGLSTIVVPSDWVGQVRVTDHWDDYRAQWSGNHRRYLRKAQRRAEETGALSLEVHTALSPAEVETLMQRGCEIEDRSWKNGAGTSILRSPEMFAWYLEQARRMSDDGHLQLSFLKYSGQPIAFEYGFRAKRTYFSPKVGYDAEYARFSPGQLLRAMLLERFFAGRDVDLVDFWGPLSEATAKWITGRYPVGKIWIAPRRVLSRAALVGYAALRPSWRRLRSWLA